MNYDHQAVAPVGERKAIALSAAKLESYTGRYAAQIQSIQVVQCAGGNLSVGERDNQRNHHDHGVPDWHA